MSALPSLEGLVVHGDGRGRGMGFPTANLLVDPVALPADGIYAARAGLRGEALAWCATASVGTNPTFAGRRERRLEVHLHDVDVDLYGTTLVVHFVEFLRPTLRFDDVAHLVRQCAEDVALCRARLALAAVLNSGDAARSGPTGPESA